MITCGLLNMLYNMIQLQLRQLDIESLVVRICFQTVIGCSFNIYSIKNVFGLISSQFSIMKPPAVKAFSILLDRMSFGTAGVDLYFLYSFDQRNKDVSSMLYRFY